MKKENITLAAALAAIGSLFLFAVARIYKQYSKDRAELIESTCASHQKLMELVGEIRKVKYEPCIDVTAGSDIDIKNSIYRNRLEQARAFCDKVDKHYDECALECATGPESNYNDIEEFNISCLLLRNQGGELLEKLEQSMSELQGALTTSKMRQHATKIP